ncbi:MAG: carboxypeptidase regulatory-like domain-containing protein, partial [Acidobacteriota bacterium]
MRGRFLDVERRPIAGVVVRLETTIGAIFWSVERTSSAEGRFEFTGVQPGMGVAQAVARGFGSRRAEIEIGPEGLDLGDLILEPEAQLEVRVVDPDSQPVGGATVTVLSGPSATADAEGIARIGGLSASERLDLEVDAGGYKKSDTFARPPLPPALEVVLEPVFTVTGR